MNAQKDMRPPACTLAYGDRSQNVERGTDGSHRYWFWRVLKATGVTQCSSVVAGDLPTARHTSYLDGEETSPPTVVISPPLWALCRGSLVPPPDMKTWHMATEHAYGWPLRCISERQDFVQDQPPVRVSGFELKIQFLQTKFGHDGIWPSNIYWPGMLANVLVWSLCSFFATLFWRGARSWRKRRRIAHGRCATCNYNLTGVLNTCPECGTSMPHPTQS